MLPSWPQAAQGSRALPSGVLDLTSHIQNRNYDVDQAISGGTSDVWFCVANTGYGLRPVAVKKLRADKFTREKIMERFFREIHAWHQLQRDRPHKYIAELLGVVDVASGNGRPGIVLPYYEKDDALHFIRTQRFGERKKGEIVSNIAEGLKHMHVSCNAVHGDLKLRNILFDNQGVPKICDFGLSRIMGIRGLFTTTTVSLSTPYAAPEILEKQLKDDDSDEEETSTAGTSTHIKTKKTDVYAFAILTAEIFMGENYFVTRSNNPLPTYERIMRGKRPSEEKVNSREYFSLLQDCWTTNPDERLRIDHITLALSWIEQYGRYYDPRRQN